MSKGDAGWQARCSRAGEYNAGGQGGQSIGARAQTGRRGSGGGTAPDQGRGAAAQDRMHDLEQPQGSTSSDLRCWSHEEAFGPQLAGRSPARVFLGAGPRWEEAGGGAAASECRGPLGALVARRRTHAHRVRGGQKATGKSVGGPRGRDSETAGRQSSPLAKESPAERWAQCHRPVQKKGGGRREKRGARSGCVCMASTTSKRQAAGRAPDGMHGCIALPGQRAGSGTCEPVDQSSLWPCLAARVAARRSRTHCCWRLSGPCCSVQVGEGVWEKGRGEGQGGNWFVGGG